MRGVPIGGVPRHLEENLILARHKVGRKQKFVPLPKGSIHKSTVDTALDQVLGIHAQPHIGRIAAHRKRAAIGLDVDPRILRNQRKINIDIAPLCPRR